MKKQGVIALVAGLLASTACWAADPIELTFRFNDPEQREMRAALDAFERDNPGIKVRLERIAWKDVRDQFLREAAVGEGPDVVHIAFVNAREMADAGAIRPVNDLAAKAPPEAGLGDFIATDLATGKDGKLYALPWTTDTWAMVYRKDLLAKAGVTALPATWDDLATVSGKVHAATGAAGFGFPAGSASAGSVWFLANYKWWTDGKALVERKGDTFSIGVTPDDVAGTMTYFKRFIDTGETPRALLGVSDWGDPAIVSGLSLGNIAIGAMPPATLRQVLEVYAKANPGKPLPFATGPIPGNGKTGGVSHLGGRMLAINANSRHPEEAWKLVLFLNSKLVFADAYKNQFPARTSLLKTMDFGPEMTGYAEQLQHTRTWGAYNEGRAPLAALWNVTGRAFGAAMSGQTPVEAATRDFLAQVDRLMKTGN
jgi:multiple sugar transport system substrate-binding protein